MQEYQSVQYELLRPSEVKSLQEQCPVACIPVRSLEWHGVQNSLGTDGLKAHAICCEAVMMFAHGERVCLNELKEQMGARNRADVGTMEMKEPEGIRGWNPLKYASAELGQEIVNSRILRREDRKEGD